MDGSLSKLEELKRRIFFTLALLVVYRIATQVPTPGVDSEALKSFFGDSGGGFLNVLNTFSGGALERFSVVALGIMPYITSSIIFSLLTVSYPKLAEIQKEPGGHKKINKWSRYVTVPLCFFQGFGIATFLESVEGAGGVPIVENPGFMFKLITVFTLTAGTMFVMWLGEQITERGIGNGISLIIFAGIAANIPSGISSTYRLYQSGDLTGLNMILIGAVIWLAFWVIIYVERAVRKVPVQYAKRVVHNRVYGGQNTHLPVKINISGVMPPIFASALMGFPATLNALLSNWVEPSSTVGQIMTTIIGSLQPGATLYTVVFVVMIFFFSYFYAPIQFKTGDISEMLRKNGGFIPGVRPGEKTAEFLDYIVERLTLVGAIYIAIICVLPTVLINEMKVPFYFGGTSLLILVGVAIDTMAQIQSFLISQRLDTAYKSRGKFKGARRF